MLNGLAYEREERHLHPDLDDPQGSRLGVTRQEDDCRAYVERRGWQLASVYEDDDLRAFSGKTRPAYRRLLEDIAAGAVDAVVAWHPDRLHRHPRELEEFIEIVEKRVSRWRLCVRAPSTSARQLVEL